MLSGLTLGTQRGASAPWGVYVEEYWADTLKALSDGQDMKDREKNDSWGRRNGSAENGACRQVCRCEFNP